MKKSFYKLCAFISLFAANTAMAEEMVVMNRGEYLAHAGDCMACHTNDPTKPYAGGHGLASPIGTIYATNITPDKIYGIGNYSYEDFERAVRHGKGRSGALYPAMPFVSYAKLTDDDVRDLYDYFMTEVKPVAEPNFKATIEWPLSMRFPLTIWGAMFTKSEPYVINVDKSAEWNRGAYLVQGLGHCGTCHTPRSATLVEQGLTEASDTFLTGAQLGGWYAPNLRNLQESNDDELLRLLKDGRNSAHAFAGPMADVTAYSLSHLTDADVRSMIAYLRDIQLPVVAQTNESKDAHHADTKAGRVLYQEYCSTCHGSDGQGEKDVVPSLVNRGNGEEGRTLNIAQVILSGAQTAHKDGRLPYEMPSYRDKFTAEEIADITNYIMTNEAWGNRNQPIKAQDVVNLQATNVVIKGWWFIAGPALLVLLVMGGLRSRRTAKEKRAA